MPENAVEAAEAADAIATGRLEGWGRICRWPSHRVTENIRVERQRWVVLKYGVGLSLLGIVPIVIVLCLTQHRPREVADRSRDTADLSIARIAGPSALGQALRSPPEPLVLAQQHHVPAARDTDAWRDAGGTPYVIDQIIKGFAGAGATPRIVTVEGEPEARREILAELAAFADEHPQCTAELRRFVDENIETVSAGDADDVDCGLLDKLATKRP